MEIILASEMGFCFGVRRAVDMMEEASEDLGGMASLGSTVHNQQVVARLKERGLDVISSLDEVDGRPVAITLLGSIFLIGFVVEGARIVATDLRPGLAAFSFIGYPISLLLDLIPLSWPTVYSWLWYIHVALVVAFVVYLPFSKFFHILISPLMVAVNTALKEH